jgi:hypothetical protein
MFFKPLCHIVTNKIRSYKMDLKKVYSISIFYTVTTQQNDHSAKLYKPSFHQGYTVFV